MSLIIDWGTFKALSPEHAPMAMPATTNRLMMADTEARKFQGYRMHYVKGGVEHRPVYRVKAKAK